MTSVWYCVPRCTTLPVHRILSWIKLFGGAAGTFIRPLPPALPAEVCPPRVISRIIVLGIGGGAARVVHHHASYYTLPCRLSAMVARTARGGTHPPRASTVFAMVDRTARGRRYARHVSKKEKGEGRPAGRGWERVWCSCGFLVCSFSFLPFLRVFLGG